jgi:hypothetical protein
MVVLKKSEAINLNPDSPGLLHPLIVVESISDRAMFDKRFPSALRVGLAPAAGKTAPFAASGASFTGDNVQDLRKIVDLDADHWFGAQARWLEFVLIPENVTITFDHPVQAVGFDLQCFKCDDPGEPKPIVTLLLDEHGDGMAYTEDYPKGLTGTPSGNPRFLGFAAKGPFRSITLHRDDSWLLANLRYVENSSGDGRPNN